MYKINRNSWFKHADFLVLDIIVLQISFILACFIRNGVYNPYENYLYREMGIILVFVDIISLFFLDTLKDVLKRSRNKELLHTFNNTISVGLVSIAYLFITKEADSFSRLIVIYTGIIYFIVSFLSRIIMKNYIRNKMPVTKKRSMLVISSLDSVNDIVTKLKSAVDENINIAGIVLTEDGPLEICGVPIVSSLENVADYVSHHWIDEVFINISSDTELPENVITQLEQTGVVLHFNILDNINKTGRKQIIENIGDSTVVTTTMNYFTPQQAFIKRLIDVFGSLVGCLITIILTIIVGPMIYISSPGPIFFKQTRIGKNGKEFNMYKFRSMYLDAEERKEELLERNRVSGDFMFKMEFDPRIIGNKIRPDGTVRKGLGHFLRETSIDEFPQFWNVLKGDMSIVGTRPPTLDEWDRYKIHHRARMTIKPGITGLWQTSGRSKITDFERVVKLDTEYINDWSVIFDVEIICKTIFAVVKRYGSM